MMMMGNNKKVKDSEAHDGDGGGDDSSGLILWPPKYYNCSFCKREFKSAQALGGHMNVHRRDRARLRMLLPPRPLLEYQNPNPNPNPSFASSSSSSSRPKSLVNSFCSSSSSGFLTMEEKKRLLECPQQNGLTIPSEGFRKKKKNNNNNKRTAFGAGKLNDLAISLDSDIGLKDTNEVLDLELRLGYQ